MDVKLTNLLVILLIKNYSESILSKFSLKKIDALRQYFPDFEFVKNEKKPRSQSFEITLIIDEKGSIFRV